MSKTYCLKYFDDVLGEVDRDTFVFTPNEDFKKDFPLSFFGGCKNPSPELIKMFLSNLVASKHNQGIDLIMADLRYPVYDLWVLLDATCGIGLSSSYWIVPKEKLHWKFNTHHVKCNPNLWSKKIKLDLKIYYNQYYFHHHHEQLNVRLNKQYYLKYFLNLTKLLFQEYFLNPYKFSSIP